MDIFNSFPLMNAYSINLDWILKKIQELEEYVRNYTAVNNVAYAGVWNITKQYPQWALVTDGDTSWLALQPVPVGIPLENTEYWQKLADLDPRIAGIIVQLADAERKIASIEEQIAGIPDYISATKAGFTPDNPDVDVLANLLATKKTVYVASGEYKLTKSIVLKNDMKLVFDGFAILSSDIPAFIVNGNGIDLYVRGVRSSIANTGTAIKYLSEDPADFTAIGNNVVECNDIYNCKIGVHMYVNNYSGIQNCETELNAVVDCGTGILLECGDIGKNWINQNIFKSFHIVTSNNGVGIKFKKGLQQNDRFNGNCFADFSCEGCRYIADLEYAWNNVFDNFRFLENTGENSIKCAESTENNEFRGLSAYTSYKFINDAGRNHYLLQVYETGLINACEDFYSLSGGFYTTNQLISEVVDKTQVVGPFVRVTEINQPAGTELIVDLPLSYTTDLCWSNPLIVRKTTGLISIRDSTGRIIATDGGAAPESQIGFALEDNSVYLLYKTGAPAYKAIKLA